MQRVQHDCQIDLKTNEIFFLPNRTLLQRVGKSLRKILMASPGNPRALRYLRNQSAIIYECRRHTHDNKSIIHPFSIFRYWWDFLMVLNLVGSLLSIPHQSTFDMARSMTPSWTFIKNFSLTIDCIDILLNFSTGYFARTRRTVEMHPRMIAKRYILTGTFIPDVLGSLPTDVFFIPSWNDRTVARELSSMIHILRIFSTRVYIKRVAETYDVAAGLTGIFTFIPLFVISVHWLACLSWIIPVAKISLTTPQPPEETSSSWINTQGLWNADSQAKYAVALMRSVTILTRSGFLSKEPIADEDQYIAMAIQILGTVTLCYVVSQAMLMFKGGNSSKLKYQATVAQLKQYMRHKQLERNVQTRFLTYYEFRYQQHFFRESEILNTLSSQVKLEIGMHSCRKLVENVTFFNNLPVSLLTRIVAQLKSEIFLTNDVIVRAGQSGDCMYFIATGTVAIYTDSGREICHLEDGAHFGEIALVMADERRVANVIAVETCELYRLERADFIKTIHPYPMLWDRIKKIAMERHEKTMILDTH
ncbi:potassium/sodium hyperpolarization-activated cyclic nucleotide-gated channel 1-like [Diachasma alloeum]|uniref:potassium/sodium hyperpolarization-activated cyclic nucleotide-gated channel 1-like n=1 Tax=Diachasma alloeum TaxID=454923 RepID=UPI0007384B6E|nr:potassium/sodium hyperpolarization-activated cyclic nucleotide-gated channel 1-like [Diachasma alloeum]